MTIENKIYRKILIVSESNLSGDSSTDITLRSYFVKWPQNKLLILTSQNTDLPFANTVFIKSDFLKWLRTISSKFLLSKKKETDNRNLVPGAIIYDGNSRIGIRQRIFAIGAAFADLLYFKVSDNIIKVIDDFRPEVIYTTMDGVIRSIKLANRFSIRYNISIVPHFMDDWISTSYTGSIWFKFPRRSLLISLNKLLERTKTGLCISQKMCKEYESKFNKKFLPLMNTINLEDFNIKSHFIKNTDNEIKFTFFGGLHLNRWKSLIMLSEVLTSLSKKVNKKLRLEIYTSVENIRKYSSKFFEGNVVFYETINHKAVFEKMKQTNFLIHVESFDESVIKFTKLSISTKIPEYLASGTPIIAIGPASITSMEYLEDNNCAYIVTNLVYPEMEKLVFSAIKGENNQLYSQNNLKLVEANHSSSQIELLRTVLLNS